MTTDKRTAVERLVFYRMAVLAIPADGTLADGVKFLKSPKTVASVYEVSVEWVGQAILVIRRAPGDNQWRTSTDEEIATEILRHVEAR